MFLKLYFISLFTFLSIDAVWLSIIAKNFYQKQIGILMKSNINWISAFLVYALFVLGLVVLIILPNLGKKSWWEIMLMGGLFGLVAYGVYDLTNLATLKNWTLTMTIVDMIWGMTVGSLVSVITFLIGSKIL